jgi:hypothetical protein
MSDDLVSPEWLMPLLSEHMEAGLGPRDSSGPVIPSSDFFLPQPHAGGLGVALFVGDFWSEVAYH